MSERYPTIVPDELDSDQRQVHDYITSEITKYFQGAFTIQNEKTGALLGPYTHFLYLPQPVVSAYVGTAKSLAGIPGFTLRCREVVILAIGEYYNAPYELYSHARVARKVGLSDGQIGDILNGKPPSGADIQEELSWEVARALIGANNGSASGRRGRIPEKLWREVDEKFGKAAAGALIHYTAYYAYTSILLNAAAVPVPEGEQIWPIPE
ncbi:hypothetical protein ABW20_dc0104588 [Dactylellina cionopaga]|nr:hypothetical protein ABW20_dc0104588 [Dactylellina cionopaga]